MESANKSLCLVHKRQKYISDIEDLEVPQGYLQSFGFKSSLIIYPSCFDYHVAVFNTTTSKEVTIKCREAFEDLSAHFLSESLKLSKINIVDIKETIVRND